MASHFEDAIANKRCFLCRRGAQLISVGDLWDVKCKTCGFFEISSSALATISENDKELLPYISIHTREASERGDKVILDSTNWKDIANAHKVTPILVKAMKLLELTASRSQPGHPVRFDEISDPPLVGAVDPAELAFLLDHLKELGYLEWCNQSWLYILKAKGWQELQTIKTRGGISGKCFVAMSFDQSLKEAYESGIFPAIKADCKMEPVRIDRVHHNDKICDKIIAEIRTSQFLLADVTLQRAGVYFEAGFAMGLGRPIIWSCRQDDLRNVHFDTRQYNHIVWKEPTDLRIQLTDRIKATITTGAVP